MGKEIYAQKGLGQLPRLLGFMDRNPYSTTYGCMDRSYWLDKSTDFSSSIFQFGVHSLALAFNIKNKENPFFKKEKILQWTKAGIAYTWSIQKNDGSFDEFYPNERGWAGPTGFLLYAILDSFERLKENFSQTESDELLENARKAARYLAKYDEVGVLSNHHAMALLPIYYAYHVTQDKKLLYNFEEKFNKFLGFEDSEGWFLEYDGPDPGYLSATVSFLGKLYQITREKWLREKILHAVEKAIKFSSFFVYPNYHYAGTVGSRQTSHFYPHGYEIFSIQFPLAKKMALFLQEGLEKNALVPPEIMADRYLAYRTSEMLLCFLDAKNETTTIPLPKLPFEQEPFEQFFPHSQMAVINTDSKYVVLNLAKGGVIKVFDKENQKLLYNDCGLIGRLEDGRIVTSQWIDYNRQVFFNDNVFSVKGKMYNVQNILPTPSRFLALRTVLLTLGKSTALSHKLKGAIRKAVILKNKPVDVLFERTFDFSNGLSITDSVELKNNLSFQALQIGDEFSVRYVPQSLFFQKPELDIEGNSLTPKELQKLNTKGKILFKRKIF